MVQAVLHQYLQTVQSQLGNLPVKVQRQLTSELMASLDERMHEMAAANPEWPRDQVIDTVLDEMGDPKDVAVTYGPQGGLVQASTGRVILHSRLLSMGPAANRTQTFRWSGFAAAGLAVFSIMAAIGLLLAQPAFLFGGDEAADVASLGADADEAARIVAADSWRQFTGERTYRFNLSSDESPFDLDIAVQSTAGCIDVHVTNPQGAVWRQGLCGSWQQAQMFQGAGEWTLRIIAEDFTGDFQATVLPHGATGAGGAKP